jgi:hypothetical protein
MNFPSLRKGAALGTALFLSLLVPVFASAQPETPANGMTPAARRAFVRDSLRQERLKARAQAAQAQTVPSQAGGASSPVAPEAANPNPPASPSPSAEANAATAPSAPAPAAFAAGSEAAPGPSEPSGTVPEAPAKPVDLPISDSLMVKSLNVRNTEIRDVLQGLGIQYAVNILMAPEVSGPITVNFSKIKLKEAIRLIAEENGYVLSVVHGAVKVEKRPAPKPLAPPPPRFKVAFEGGKLSVDVQKIPADQVIRRLVEATGKNIVSDQGPLQDMSAFFRDMDLRKGLNLLAETNGMSVREKDGVYAFYREAWSSGAAGKDGSSVTVPGRMRISVKDKLVSLEVTGAPLSDIISSISAQTGISTVVYGELKGTVTMRVSDIPIEQAFQILFRGTDFTFWVHNGIYFIGPQTIPS